MDELHSGEVLHVTDKGAINDMPAWVKASGHELMEQTEDGDVLKFWIKKG